MKFYVEIWKRSIKIGMSAGGTGAFWKCQKETHVKMSGVDGT